MSHRIHKLSPFLANQIAAGEVIERPASVVKELIENSLDAGASDIDIDIENGGMGQIRVCDNGSGIHPDDLALALEQHATSKIKAVSDLEGITSFGFRGEALASMGSVAKLGLQARLATEKMGWQLVVEGGSPQPLKPAAMLPGTTVEVLNLFFNIPARRKFLRSERTEFVHIDEWFKRIALSAFNVSFRLRQHHKLLRDFKAGNRERRVAQIYGQTFMKQALEITFEATGLKLWGWVGSPHFACNQASLQNLYVNGRWVRDKLILHAVKQAYRQKGFDALSPAYLLYLEVDAGSVDVNVHPTKHEVRFRESRLIYDFISHSLSNVLGQTKTLFEMPTPVVPLPAIIPVPTHHHPQAEQEHVVGMIGSRFLLISDASALRVIDTLTFCRKKTLAQLQVAIKTGVVATKPLCIPFRAALPPEKAVLFLSFLERLGFKGAVLFENAVVIRHAPAVMQGQNGPAVLEKIMQTWLADSDAATQDHWRVLETCIEQIKHRQDPQALFDSLKADPLFKEHAEITQKQIDLEELFA